MLHVILHYSRGSVLSLASLAIFVQAIEGIGNLRLGRWNQQMVPIREMTDVMKVVREIQTVKRGQWVRLRRTVYRDDVAQVC